MNIKTKNILLNILIFFGFVILILLIIWFLIGSLEMFPTKEQIEKNRIISAICIIITLIIEVLLIKLKKTKNMNLTRLIYILIIFTLTFYSCGRIKNKGHKFVNKTEQKSKDLVDNIVSHFDAYKPDTKFNKKRFKDFLQVELTNDIKNIYCFGNATGIDAIYQFSFNCDTTTVRKIIEKHQLKLNKTITDYAFGLQYDFEWWDKKKIENLDLYIWEGDRYFKYFWYDKTEQKAYYLDFDM